MESRRLHSPSLPQSGPSHALEPDPFLPALLAAMLDLNEGDFSVRLPRDLTGLNGKIADAFNDTATVCERRASEIARVTQSVGKQGKLKQRMSVAGARGGWADEVFAVNNLIDDLVWPTSEVTRAVGAVAQGDLSRSVPLDVEGRPLEGEFLRSAKLVNTMIDQLSVFTSEVTRVAREVGTEGKLGGQAKVKGASGVWKELTESVNQMAGNLTAQVRNIADVTIAVANGDLSKKITVDVRGEILQLKEAINTMVDQLRGFAAEVTRVAREVGTDGKLGGQAVVPGVAGTWKDLTDSVNAMASNLTAQVRNIAGVTTAVARGDLSRKITVDVKGEILELKITINTMVDQLNAFASEVSRVAREVGTEGKLGGRAEVPEVAGTWKDLTDSVNAMGANLTAQVRNIAEVTTAVARGDLSRKITVDVKGEIAELKDTINTMVDQLNGFASEVTRVAREVGTEGKLGGQAVVPGVGGTWKNLTDSVNSMASNLTGQVRNIAYVATSIARGDLSSKITVDVQGEILELKNTINTMVDQLNAFASEVSRVAREVGTEGKLGGQAQVHGVAGTWKDLTDNVNSMASNLTGQVRNIADVATAIARGDLSRKITVDVKGEILQLKDTINTMVDQLNAFASEVSRVAREVGTEGKLGGQAEVPDVAGTWKDLTDNVNWMASNLTGQVRNIADVATAIANGDLSRKITVDVKGEILELKNTVNTMVDQLNAFASEVTRVAREVGTEGKLGGQAEVTGVAGTWKGLTDNVNFMASNLTGQVRNIAEVATAVARGDLSRKITVDVKGEILELKNTVNTMVDQLNAFASEVSRVAREVGTDGKLGGQAVVTGVAGTWKDVTDNVNQMAGNLTAQVRNIAEVTVAVATGDLSKKITVDVRGEILQLKDTINTMVEQLRSFAAEVTRVAREVGTEGKLGGQAAVPGVAGTWKDLTDNVNSMASNLTGQVRNIADVATSIARGDLSRKITVDVKGEILELKNTVNTMVDQLNAFASEVSRVAREVGTEGKLGGQAVVPGVAGTWKDLTDNVNSMASNLTGQVRNIAEVTIAVANGDLSRKITVDVRGEILQLKEATNAMVEQLRSFASEVTRVAREVGTEGRLGVQAVVPGVAGTWKDLTDSVNVMGANLTAQVRNIAEVTTAVARGDLSRKITVDVKGEILELKNTINTMVDQLRAFAAEVTRVAREVGTEGKLGGQAEVPGVAGTWKDLTDSVNVMAANLTDQVRGIVKVVTAVADGSLRQKLTVEAKGEVAALAETINNMTDTLATFAQQVTNVAREVGVDGRLGGQAHVPGASGTWKDLTGNVNLLAANLTNQVRAIAEVATAVTKGDLTRSIQVEARGEVAELKDNINTMIDNLRATTDSNQEQDWLKTNLAKFTRMLQGQRDLVTVGKLLLSELAPLVNAQQGTVYQMLDQLPDSAAALSLLAGYAVGDDQPTRIEVGKGLVGQCALEKQRILITKVPPKCARIQSSLGATRPKNIVVLPVLFEGETKAVIELSSIEPFTTTHLTFLEQLTQSIGVVLNTIEATMRTENLLQQSQQLTIALQTRQTELQQTNEQLALKAQELAEQNVEVERKNKEVEQARRALEEKAAELALTSKYKSEFLANMSHELRTPLNSILILGQQLADNPSGSLAPKEVDFARNIHSAGTDLLTLINDILDLSKIESGTVTVDVEEITFGSLRDSAERTFHHLADSKHLEFAIDIGKELPPTLTSDPKRLQQILKNLLSNAFKFTQQGRVRMRLRQVSGGWSPDHPILRFATSAVAIEVEDSGIGIAPQKQKLIFEAFQQADAGTSRKFGGTGLGLAISRELAILLGGEIRLVSEPGKGSTFTLFLPFSYTGPARVDSPSGLADAVAPRPVFAVAKAEQVVLDDRDSVQATDQTVLIVDDDPHYARVLLGVARDKGFKGIVASRGHSALALARQYQPTAITLDVFLPDMLGWTVLNDLKLDPSTRHIPVQMLSVEEERQHGLSHGAFSYLVKPSSTEDLEHAFDRLASYVVPHKKRLLVVEDNDIERLSIVDLLIHDDIEVVAVGTGSEALEVLRERVVECCVVDLKLPDMTGFQLIERMQTELGLRDTPVVVFTGKELTQDEETAIRTVAKSVVLKDVRSPERLFDETALFLHRVVATLPEAKRRMLERLHKSNEVLRGKKVIIVDDDARNIFALNSVLENHGMEVLTATNGRQAIELIEQTSDLSVVLMDIMMPEMDGYETMRQIRQNADYRTLPILALTAKAMKGDREKCLQAGASDYIAKPVNQDQLLSLLRVWLYPLTAGHVMTDDGVKILIVDDQPRNLDALEVILQPLGCTLVRAHSADEALLAILRDDFGALILDIQMPGMNGIELATLVKQRNRTKDVPILFLTAHVSHDEDVLRGYGVGGVDYLSKPIKPDVLRSKVAVFAELHRKTRALSALNSELQHQVAERKRAEVTLHQVNLELESRVAERTAALALANRAVKENEERLRMAIDMAGIAPWEWDARAERPAASDGPSGLARSWDLGAHTLRWTAELMKLWALEGVPHATYGDFHCQVHRDDRDDIEARYETALRERRPFEVEFRIALPSGEVRWIYAKGGAVYDDAGRPVRVIGNNMDITERKRAEEALREADRHRSEFLAMLAHELRNPLAPVRTAAELLKRLNDGASEAQHQAIEAIGRQVGQMTRLIDDLLDVSRIASGKIALRKAPVDVASVVNQTVEACQSLFDGSGVHLTVTLPPSPLVVEADPTRVAQVLDNLLSNAAKFTPAGGHVRLTVERQGGGQAVISVRDDGIGLDRDQIPRVFDRFVQVDTSLERARGGLGLGLTLVKTLVELHDGTVDVQSDGLGRGAEFIVSLPVASGTPLAEPAPAAQAPDPVAVSARRILVVDDSLDSAITLGQLLELSGHEVRLAHDGLEAVDVAGRFLPDFVLLDIGLPKLNGYEAARRIRALPSGQAMVIVALTGWGQDSDRQRTAESGFDVHLVKPVDPDVLSVLISGGQVAGQRIG